MAYPFEVAEVTFGVQGVAAAEPAEVMARR
jgi:hypothetical protein